MTPLQLYYQHLATQDFKPDAKQQQVMSHLQRMYEELMAAQRPPSNTWQRWLAKLHGHKTKPVRGVYLWGSVGIGKTWLMDTFYQALDGVKKRRVHFHRFMYFIHGELQKLQGQADPLGVIAHNLAEQVQIICFDEFLVTDIADAMILANLFAALFAEGITLVITANVAPDDLYRNGAQRDSFVPAITLIKQHLEVVHLTSAMDYRLRALEQAQIYYHPLTAQVAQEMQATFLRLTNDAALISEPLVILGRSIATLRLTEEYVWFDFSVLCNVPRSQQDYLEIARYFHTVFLSNVPQIDMHQDNLARYLINLVDVFYDARVKLIISAAVNIRDLYPNGRLTFEFQRTQSRLIEMQSIEYLRRPHLG